MMGIKSDCIRIHVLCVCENVLTVAHMKDPKIEP